MLLFVKKKLKNHTNIHKWRWWSKYCYIWHVPLSYLSLGGFLSVVVCVHESMCAFICVCDVFKSHALFPFQYERNSWLVEIARVYWFSNITTCQFSTKVNIPIGISFYLAYMVIIFDTGAFSHPTAGPFISVYHDILTSMFP